MGCSVKPKNATFTFFNEDSYDTDNITQTSFKIFVTSLKNPEKDNIGGVKDNLWNDIWCNQLENVFKLYRKSTINNLDDAKQYMISIGMTEKTSEQVKQEWGI